MQIPPALRAAGTIGRGNPRPGRAGLFGSAADSVGRENVSVTLHVLALQVVKQPTTTTDELEEAAPGVMILRVHLEVSREVIDALRHETDLHFRRSGVSCVNSGLFDDALLSAGKKRHCFLQLLPLTDGASGTVLRTIRWFR